MRHDAINSARGERELDKLSPEKVNSCRGYGSLLSTGGESVLVLAAHTGRSGEYGETFAKFQEQ